MTSPYSWVTGPIVPEAANTHAKAVCWGPSPSVEETMQLALDALLTYSDGKGNRSQTNKAIAALRSALLPKGVFFDGKRLA